MSVIHSSLRAALVGLALAPAPAHAGMLIYLDFNGHSDPGYPGCNVPISLPAFQGGPASREAILRHVREDFAPFDVTFATSDMLPPAEVPAGVDTGYSDQNPAIRVAIGGTNGTATTNGDICGTAVSGLATNPRARNTVWVVEHDGANRRSDRNIGNTASHELGHAFGHLAAEKAPWDSLRIPSYVSHFIAEIAPPDQNAFSQVTHDITGQGKTQIMNGPRALARDIWWRDGNVFKALRVGGDPDNPDDWTRAYQDDVLSLTAILGLASDDHADRPQDGSPMTPDAGPLPSYETRLHANGVVEMNNASWAGMCPPVPRWQSCPGDPIYDQPPTDPPTIVVDYGQSVILAVTKDFFRFDIPAIGRPTGYDPRITIRVETLDGQAPGAHAANLDADLEVWFYDPATGRWRDITSRGSRLDGPRDLWAEWSSIGLGSNGVSVGEYAVAVKSQGAYGDLGQYTVHVIGTRGLQVAATEGPRSRPDYELDASTLIARIGALVAKAELVGLVAGLAENGVRVGPSEGYAGPASASHTASKSTRELMATAMAQTSALAVVSRLVDWDAMSRTERANVHRRLADALRRFE